LETVFFDRIDSTQKRLLQDLRLKKIEPPVAYVTRCQTDGIGSRNSRWIGCEGNLFFSFAIAKSALPADLPPVSASIYFGFLFKEELKSRGSKVWLKWPNDFYLRKKIGGCITQMSGDVLVCGIGLNLLHAPEGFEKLDVGVDPKELLEGYFSLLKSPPAWKQIFSKYRIEFQKSQKMQVHVGGRRVSLELAKLMPDGSITIEGERIYSLR